jgi:CubicO group peptidase (beta-lactamase class C family)
MTLQPASGFYNSLPTPPLLNDGIAVGTPAQVGLQTAPLQSLLDRLQADPFPDLHSVLVWCSGHLVLEAYFNGASGDDLHDVRSAGKSVTGALLGIALDRRALAGVDLPMLHFFPDHPPPKSDNQWLKRITVRHLLEMRSGFDADEDRPESAGYEDKLIAAQDWLQFALQVPVTRAPGSAWAYASLNTMLLGRIVEAATGRDLQDFADQFLFRPLGVTAYQWERAPDGHIVGQGSLWLHARDALKFGLLYLHHGRWHGRQLIAPGWVAESTRLRTPLALDNYVGYGYQWWRGSAPSGDRQVEFAFASGNGGQKIVVIDSLGMVIVITSAAYGLGRGQQRSHMIIRDLLQAVAWGDSSEHSNGLA